MSERLVTALEQTWSGIADLLAGLPDEDWRRPTPCEAWDVKDLAAHLGAIESWFQGMPQPSEPPPPTAGIDAWTAAGVAARRGWSTDEVRAELAEASRRQLDALGGLDRQGWDEETDGPTGSTTRRGLADIRLLDLYIHLLDLRTALERPLEPEREPDALELCVDRVVSLTPWGAVKKAGLGDGVRIHVDLSPPAARCFELVVDEGRGRLIDVSTMPEPETSQPGKPEKPEKPAADLITGPAPAYLLLAAGRPMGVEWAGGIVVAGPHATRLGEGYRIFS